MAKAKYSVKKKDGTVIGTNLTLIQAQQAARAPLKALVASEIYKVLDEKENSVYKACLTLAAG